MLGADKVATTVGVIIGTAVTVTELDADAVLKNLDPDWSGV
jgi:hypothetical protein